MYKVIAVVKQIFLRVEERINLMEYLIEVATIMQIFIITTYNKKSVKLKSYSNFLNKFNTVKKMVITVIFVLTVKNSNLMIIKNFNSTKDLM